MLINLIAVFYTLKADSPSYSRMIIICTKLKNYLPNNLRLLAAHRSPLLLISFSLFSFLLVLPCYLVLVLLLLSLLFIALYLYLWSIFRSPTPPVLGLSLSFCVVCGERKTKRLFTVVVSVNSLTQLSLSVQQVSGV